MKNNNHHLSKAVLSLSLAAMSAIGVAQQSQIVYLSGTGVDDTKTWRFKCTDGQRAGKWGKIQVPCNWELQGYGDYTYGRWYYDKKGSEPSKEEGFYEYSFKVPAAWKNQRVVIWFDGVMTDTEVSINGQKAGEMHQGGFYRFGYDISSLVKTGSNKLEVHVWKHSANKSINAAERKADWWLFGGIYRPVWLEVTPTTAISHLAVDAQANGAISVVTDLAGDCKDYTLSAEVCPLDNNRPVGSLEATVVQADQTQQVLRFNCSHVTPWNCEVPTLYNLTVRLNDASGKVVHEKQVRVGFRTIELRPKDGFYLNGTKLLVKGVNRHSITVDGGRTTSKAWSIKDAEIIKGMNMNAIRSHYPPDEHFLDVCDSLGILYMDELAGWQNAYDTEVGAKLVKELINRDVNHPCIFVWSNGNEGGWNYRTDPLFDVYDPQKRHVVHPWADFNQVDTHHYPTYLTGVGRFNNGSNVFMPTEFMHAMYDQGGGAGLKDFWDRWTTSPLFAGGFIWAYCDEAIKRTDMNGFLDSNGSNAPDGIVGPQRELEGSYFAIREVWSPIQVKPIRITPSFDGTLYVSNHYLYKDLSQCKLNYRLKRCPSPLNVADDSLKVEVFKQSSLTLPDVQPGETRKVKLDIANIQEADVLEIEAVDYNGKVICNWTYPVHTPAEYFETAYAMKPALLNLQKVEALDEAEVVSLKNDRMEVRFSKENGQILSVKKDGNEIPFNNGPIAVGMKMKYRHDLSSVRTEGDVATFVARYQGGVDSIVWKLTPGNDLMMDAVMLNRASGGGGFDDAFMDSAVKNLGLTFSYPESACTGMTWMGRGPYRVWKNRVPGTNFGIWHKDYNNTITCENYETLVYPEFKGYHANLYWAKMKSNTAPFTVYCQSENIFYRVFTPEEPHNKLGKGRTMPEFPVGDISFLLDIPAIQSFKPIEQQGPQSQPGNIRIKSGDDGLRIKLMFEF